MYRLSECVLEERGGGREIGVLEGRGWSGKVYIVSVCVLEERGGGGEGDRGVGIRGWGRGWGKMQGVLLARRL